MSSRREENDRHRSRHAKSERRVSVDDSRHGPGDFLNIQIRVDNVSSESSGDERNRREHRADRSRRSPTESRSSSKRQRERNGVDPRPEAKRVKLSARNKSEEGELTRTTPPTVSRKQDSPRDHSKRRYRRYDRSDKHDRHDRRDRHHKHDRDKDRDERRRSSRHRSDRRRRSYSRSHSRRRRYSSSTDSRSPRRERFPERFVQNVETAKSFRDASPVDTDPNVPEDTPEVTPELMDVDAEDVHESERDAQEDVVMMDRQPQTLVADNTEPCRGDISYETQSHNLTGSERNRSTSFSQKTSPHADDLASNEATGSIAMSDGNLSVHSSDDDLDERHDGVRERRASADGSGSESNHSVRFEPDHDVGDADVRAAELRNFTPRQPRPANGARSRSLQSGYTYLHRIHAGTYGVVSRYVDRETKEFVAVKEIKYSDQQSKSGFPRTAVREILILRQLNHENIVHVKEVCRDEETSKRTFIVMEFCANDLSAIIKYQSCGGRLPMGEVKCIIKQLFEGLAYLHSRYIMHRDIKPQNLLLTSGGVLKICDFGMARRYYGAPWSDQHSHRYTPACVTLWYRAPEMFIAKGEWYGPQVDIWSAGIVLLDLLKCKQYFAHGKQSSDVGQIQAIARLIGKPASPKKRSELFQQHIYPHIERLVFGRPPRLLTEFIADPNNPLEVNDGKLIGSGCEFLTSILTWDPWNRLTAEQAATHRWYNETPAIQHRSLMQNFKGTNFKQRDQVKRDFRKAEESRVNQTGFFVR